MAVFTEVSEEEAQSLLDRLQLGQLTQLRGIEGGIENTNYFATTEKDGASHDYVLTVFERLSFEQLPFYLHLMKHLAQNGVPVPDPSADKAGDILHTVKNKPAAVVNRLAGKSELSPNTDHCAALGKTLAEMHLAGKSFNRSQPNLRGLPWWNETVPKILEFLTPEQSALLQSELAYQNHIAASSNYAGLPRGPIHADLFRDNVMFDTAEGGSPKLSGFFDFYFAGVDSFLFDVAVCLNDWCIDLSTGISDDDRARALITAYQSVRPLEGPERRLLSAMLRAGALRFWISRLWDFYLPREAAMLQPHDPTHFERVLKARISHAFAL